MIVVFGSVNVDFVTRVPAIPRPGETVLGPAYAVIPGGKGANQALAARRAGAQVALVGAVGQDPFAQIGLSLLETDGVDCAGVARVSAPTGAAFIAVDAAGENAIVVASGANAAASAVALEGLRLSSDDVLLLQREVPEDQAILAARIMRDRGGRVILNAAPAGSVNAALLSLLDVLIMNEHEVLQVGATLGLMGEPDEIARRIDSNHAVAAIVTLGADGAIGWTGGVRRSASAVGVQVVDTTAAGDAFCGAFAASLAQGLHFGTALSRAAVAGSLACGRHGAQPSLPWKDAIDAAMAGRIA